MQYVRNKSFLWNVDNVARRPVFTDPHFEDTRTEVIQTTEIDGHKVEVYEKVTIEHRCKVYPKGA